jgi:hypothetical protein
MSLTNFIPQLWSARILSALRKSLVYGQPGVVNTEYEGELSGAGDTVNINSIGDPTIFDYTKNTDMPAPETLTDATRQLLIDQSKAFNFQVDDIDKAQTRPNVMDEAMSRAAYRLRDIADQHIAVRMVASGTENTLGTLAAPIDATAANAYDVLVDLGTKLDEANVTREGRWSVIPFWFEGLLSKDDRFIGDSGSGEVLRNARVGRAAGFNLYGSNNVPTTASTEGTSRSTHRIVAGVGGATSFADQISEVEAYRPERRFGDALKGLHVYGCKVVRPEQLALLTAVRPA